jgi:uncharacterized protein (TIGR02679 family)
MSEQDDAERRGGRDGAERWGGRDGADSVDVAATVDGVVDGEALKRLRRLLGGPTLADLRRRLRARYERGAPQDVFTVTQLSEAERHALERLLGRSARSAGSMRLSLSELDAAISRAGIAADFRAALEALDGPLVDKKRVRMEREREWRAAVERVNDSRLREVVADAGGLGLVKRWTGNDPARGRELLERAERVLAKLPAADLPLAGVPLARLAADALGDSHALDAGRPEAALVLRALGAGKTEAARVMRALDRDETGSDETGSDAIVSGEIAFDADDRTSQRVARRDQWASVGVTLNELAAPVLILNLRARGDSAAARLSETAAEAGSPTHLTLRALLRHPPRWAVGGRTVHVCENASVVAVAADVLGTACAPLVCTDGMPGAAQQTLLRQLREQGAKLRYHGDFDWPGIEIGNFIVRAYEAAAWRFGASDYRAARVDVELPLSGRRRAAAWDAELANAMDRRGVVVHEESVVDTLLSDLAG